MSRAWPSRSIGSRAGTRPQCPAGRAQTAHGGCSISSTKPRTSSPRAGSWSSPCSPSHGSSWSPSVRAHASPPAPPDPVKNSGDDAVTTREVELVDRGQRGFDALDEHLPQAPACAKQARLHRFLCDAQTLRDLGAAHSLDRAQDEDHAEVFGKRRHRFLKQPSYLDIARLLLWARSPRSGHERFFGERVERIKPLASANAGKRLVDGDAGQPRREPRPPLEIVQVLVRTHVGILHHVLGFGALLLAERNLIVITATSSSTFSPIGTSTSLLPC